MQDKEIVLVRRQIGAGQYTHFRPDKLCPGVAVVRVIDAVICKPEVIVVRNLQLGHAAGMVPVALKGGVG